MKTIQQTSYPQGAEKWILVLTVLSCSILVLIDSTIVNVALPEISGGIGASRVEIAWVITSYIVGNAIVIPLSGMLSDLFGRRNYFTVSVILFTATSFLCGISNSLQALILWRFIQGLAGGGLMSTAQSIMIGAFPPEKINTANAIFGMGAIMGPILGPFLGGLIVQNLSWHWVFFVNLPIGAVASVLSWMYVTNLKTDGKKFPIDWWGIVFLVITVSSLQYILEEGPRKDWFSDRSIVLLTIASVLGMAAFIWQELHTKYPAVNIRLFKNWNLTLGNILVIVFAAMMMSSMFFFPMFVQISLGWDTMQTGLYLMFMGACTAASMMVVRKLVDSGLKPKMAMLIGVFLYVSYLTMFSFSSPQSHGANFLFPLALGGIGAGFLFLPMLTLALSGLRGSDLAQGTGLFNVTKQLGGAVGIALINIFMNHRSAKIGQGLVGYANEYNSLFTSRIEQIKQAFLSAGYAADDALKAAYQLTGSQFHTQQILMGYNAGYLFMAIILLVVGVPVILMIKSAKKPLHTDSN